MDSATLSFKGVTDSITLDKQFVDSWAGVDIIKFSDGVTWNQDMFFTKYLASVSTSGNDIINGMNAHSETITGGLGNDTMSGLGGDDTYIHKQGDGQDTIMENWYAGNDVLKFTGAGLTSQNLVLTLSADKNSGTLSFHGFSDNVTLLNEFTGDDYAGVETIQLGDGTILHAADLLKYQSHAGNETLNGTNGNDTLYGDGGNDKLYGGNGNDILFGGNGADTLDGGAGINTASYVDQTAGIGLNLMAQSSWWGSDNTVDSLTHIQNVVGTDYNDLIIGDANANSLVGGAGDDTLNAIAGNDTLMGEAGNDFLYGGTHIDQLFGGAGNDTLQGGMGADNIDGGTGINTASYSDQVAGVGINLMAHTSWWGTDNTVDALTNIQNIIGSNYNDLIIGDAGANNLIGGLGNDMLNAIAGQDTLEGGAGQDTLIGGSGSDIFVYRLLSDSLSAAPDLIDGFTKGADHIDVRGMGLTSIVNGAANGTQMGYSYDAATDHTMVFSASGFKLALVGHLTLANTDFIFA